MSILWSLLQIGIGTSGVAAAAWVVLLGGILLTVLWVRQLFA